MSHATTTIARVALVLLLAGCAPSGRGQEPGQDARERYLRACASCHGAEGRGDGPVAPALCVPPRDLTTLSSRYGGVFPRDLVIAVITGERDVPGHGTREMPVWSERFGTGSGATAAAALYARRRLEMLADHLESLQRTP